MIENAYLIPLLPLIGAALVGLLGRPLLRGASHWPVVLGVGLAAAFSIVLFINVANLDHEKFDDTHVLYNWIPTGDSDNLQTADNESALDVSFRIDPLTAIMLVTVCVISLLVVIYSHDYMRHGQHPERGYERFFAYLGMFVFSMCMLVLAGNFLLLYLGWELVGLCSYLLIGFYYPKPAAAKAARKAFIVNRIGDFGFGIAILLIYLTFGSLDYRTVFAAVEMATHHDAGGLMQLLDLKNTAAAHMLIETIDARITPIALLLFCGAVGKSAQLPLYVWLPDAMEGPSPVSALIHAATMVTAGVYMIARCGAIFTASTTAMTTVAVVGGVSALYAATIALAQYDLKRILAFSTVSQLGYMFLGLGVFAADSAIFHLYTHAFFKALLFLGAGSVMHAMGGIIDVRQFGGLRKLLPWTCITFFIGCLALSGFPLFSGFWSKDEIIHAAMVQSPVLGYIGLFTALLTAFYTFRMFFLAFYGEERVPTGVHAHESGPWMRWPLVLLSIGAAGAGYAGVHIGAGGFIGFLQPHGPFQHFLQPVTESFRHAMPQHHGESGGGHLMMYVSAAMAIAAMGAAYVAFVMMPELAVTVRHRVGVLFTVLNRKYYVDEIYDAAIVQPLWRSGEFLYGFDRYFIDGLVWFVTAIPRLIGFVLRTWQRGVLQGYGTAMVVGLAIMVLWILWGR